MCRGSLNFLNPKRVVLGRYIGFWFLGLIKGDSRSLDYSHVVRLECGSVVTILQDEITIWKCPKFGNWKPQCLSSQSLHAQTGLLFRSSGTEVELQ